MVLGVHLGGFLIVEKFFCGDFAVQQAKVLAFGHPEWGYHRVNQFERGLGLGAENHHPFIEFFLVVVGDGVGL